MVVTRCMKMWLRMHGVPPIPPSAKKQRNAFAVALSQWWHADKSWSQRGLIREGGYEVRVGLGRTVR